MTYYQKLDIIHDYIDDELTKLKPNYGFIEKYYIADEILMYNDYLLPKDKEHCFELMKLIINEHGN